VLDKATLMACSTMMMAKKMKKLMDDGPALTLLAQAWPPPSSFTLRHGTDVVGEKIGTQNKK
jgi:hypothetical protein